MIMTMMMMMTLTIMLTIILIMMRISTLKELARSFSETILRPFVSGVGSSFAFLGSWMDDHHYYYYEDDYYNDDNDDDDDAKGDLER